MIEPMNRRLRRLIECELKRSPKGSPDILKTAAVFASFTAFMYFKSRLVPMYADDYPYSFIWDGDNNGNLLPGNQHYRRIKSFTDLIKSQISHSRTWSGRSLSHSLVQLFLSFNDKKYFDRVNAFVMLTQLFLSASIGSGRITLLRHISPEKALLLTAGFFFSVPDLFGSCIWLTGSMNYLWMGILQSAFVLPYSLKYHRPFVKIPGILAFLSGLVSGWSSEAGAGASLMLAGLGTLYSLNTKRYASWMGWGLSGAFLGIILLLLSPGNRIRFKLDIVQGDYASDSEEDTLKDSPPGVIPVKYLYTPEMFKKWFI